MVLILMAMLFFGFLVRAWPVNIDNLLSVSMRMCGSFSRLFLRFLFFLQLFLLDLVCLGNMTLSIDRLEVLDQINWVGIAVTRIWLSRQSYALNEWL